MVTSRIQVTKGKYTQQHVRVFEGGTLDAGVFAELTVDLDAARKQDILLALQAVKRKLQENEWDDPPAGTAPPPTGGGGGSSAPAPVLAATLTSEVPTDYVAGAVVAFAAPTNAATGITWSMTSAAGLTIDSESGLVTIANTGAFYTALASGITFTITAENGVGTDSCDVTLTEGEPLPEYATLNAANRSVWFDAMSNAHIEIDETGEVISWTDRDDAERIARNDYFQERPTFVGRSVIGPQRPAIKFSAPTQTGRRYGLFFPDKPLGVGARSFTLDADQVFLIPDLKLPDSNADISPRITSVSPSPWGSVNLLCVHWDDAGVFTLRINGAEIATNSSYSSDYIPDYPGAIFAVYYSSGVFNGAANVLVQGQQIGSSGDWNRNIFQGEMLEIIGFANSEASLT